MAKQALIETDWNNLTPNQLMAIFVQNNVETNERISETQEQLVNVISRVDETNELLKETVINQRHIEKEVDEGRENHRALVARVDKGFIEAKDDLVAATKETTVKNTQLQLAKYIAVLAMGVAVTVFTTVYLPGKKDADNSEAIFKFLTERFPAEQVKEGD